MSHFRPAADLDLGRAYPRPQLVRESWMPLNGEWEFALDHDAIYRGPADVLWDRTIAVPFAPETPASGVGDQGFYHACWYCRDFALMRPTDGSRILLHFGAVDHRATVWINGATCGEHEGGYTPFAFDITDLLDEGPLQRVVVRAYDDPSDLAKPRGKQDWQLKPHSIWYPRTTGIWQTVWIERVPATWIRALRWTPNLERWEIGLEAAVAGQARERLRLCVRLRVGDTLIADDTYAVVAGSVHRRIALSDPGIDDSRNEFLWSPHSPILIQAELELWGERGELLDSVSSYTALRAVSVQGDRFLLNGRPFFLRLVLDQGYWPTTGITAPDDAALRRDVELAKAMGFNGVRKHQKIEDPRYLYWADRLGLLVWEEMPSAYRFTQTSVGRLTREWTEALLRDISHPCIVAWVPINESWGVPNLPDVATERHFVRGLYHLTKTLDPSRPVIGNDGWESVATDIIGIHDYDDSADRISRRYHAEDELPRLFRRERPGGRVLVLEGQSQGDQPIVLSEFGGICYAPGVEGVWGYSRTATARQFARQYSELLLAVRNIGVLTGFCYTQFADTYQEANGLLFADRTPKFPLDEIAAATSGRTARFIPEPEHEEAPGRP
ncbi:MAG TPA: glycoside hydrolase family 2 TIM barrel-domain containing protein [Vicinamibacterales bacterium]|nr:glycoside hydrolase family 2 TIM barrel-domain containing protein [Vicinamibacterales bacterium]